MKFSSFLLAAGAAAAPTLDRRQGLPAGVIYNSCTTPGVVALTFDDGPYAFTSRALDILDAAGFKATFFLNGANWASIYDYSSVVQRMYSSGYMVGSHTWSHADLATLDAAGIDSQMTQVETALISIIGVRPLWVRLPYLSSIPATLTELGNLGYAIAGIDIDTKDYENTATPQVAINNYIDGLNAGGTISLAHDVYQNTVENVLPGIIAAIQAKGLRSVTLAECLGLSLSSVYTSSPRGSTTSSTTSTTTSTTKTTSTTATTTTGTSTTKTTTTTTGTSTSTGTSATGTSTTKTTTTTATGTSATGTSTTTTATGTSAGTSTTKTTTTTTATGTSATGTSTTTTATGTSTTTTATGTTTTGTTATGTSTTKTTTTTTGTSTTATGTSTTKTTTTTGTSTTGTSTTKTSTSTAAATSTGYPVSTDWQCGASVGTKCPSGNCCSRYGWCGTTRDYCKTGCQSAFGICS